MTKKLIQFQVVIFPDEYAVIYALDDHGGLWKSDLTPIGQAATPWFPVSTPFETFER